MLTKEMKTTQQVLIVVVLVMVYLLVKPLSLLALHGACSTGAHACVTVLLANGAEPNVVDNWQQTALFVATEGGHTDCILKVIIYDTLPAAFVIAIIA